LRECKELESYCKYLWRLDHKMTLKIAYGALKTEDNMRYDYQLADYPYSRATYDHFVALNKNNKPQSNTPALSGTKDKNGIYKPNPIVVQLGKELRDLLNK